MKINKIASLLKKGKTIHLYDGTDCQWVSTGYATYSLAGLPWLEEKNIVTMFDIPEDQRGKYYFEHKELPQTMNFSDTDKTEGVIDSEHIKIGTHGCILKIFQTSSGAAFVDSDLLVPFKDSLDYLEYYERHTVDGKVYIAVKNGLTLIGIILPSEVVNDDLIKDLERILVMSRETLDLKKQRETAADAQ